MTRFGLAVLLAVLLVAGCGGEVDPARTPAGAAYVDLLEDLYNGRFGQAYGTLHPEHRKVVTRSLFQECARSTIPVGQLDSIEILNVSDKTTRLPVLGEQRTKAVRIRLTFTDGQSTEPYVNHEVKAGDRWHWVLNEAAVRAYEAGRCPVPGTTD